MIDNLAESIGAALRQGIGNEDPALPDSLLHIWTGRQTFLHLLLYCLKVKLVCSPIAGPDQRLWLQEKPELLVLPRREQRDQSCIFVGRRSLRLPAAIWYMHFFCAVYKGSTCTTKLCVSINSLLGLCSFDVGGFLLTWRENACFGMSCHWLWGRGYGEAWNDLKRHKVGSSEIGKPLLGETE